MIGSYRLEALIGVGGMGRVYRAWDEKLGRTVAVKLLREYLSRDEVARKRFVREARLSSKIVHPYVATVFDVVEESGDVYLVMEHVEGRTLNQIIRRRKLSIPEVARYGCEIAEALNVIHSSGLVHRDLKPSNVMITNDNHVKVMDFGVARQFSDDARDPGDSSLTRSGMVAGTPAYMSPEQLRGRKADNRSDLFSLGIVLFEAVTGRHPFLRETLGESMSAILNDPPGGDTEPRSLGESSAIRATILRLLEKDPERRYQSAEELIPLLELPTDEFQLHGRPARRIRWRPWMTMALVALAVAPVGLGIWWLGKNPGTLPLPETVARPLVAVLPFEDHTLDGEHDGEMLAALLSADLAESKVARSMGHDRVIEVVSGVPRGSPKLAYIEAIRGVADVNWIVVASVFRQGDAYEAVVDVYRPGVGEPHASMRVGAAGSAGLVGLAAVQIQKAIDPRSTPEEQPAHADPGRSSDSEEALILEYEGRKALRDHRFTDAIELLEEALTIDPNFVGAQLRLAAALDLAGYGQRAREAADRATRMVERSGDASGVRTALEVQAAHAKLHGDRETEIEVRRQLVERYPDEPEVLHALAEALQRAAQNDEALAYVERSLAFENRDPWRHVLLALILNALGRHEAALAALDRAEELFALVNSTGGVARTMARRALVEWSRGNNEAAARGYREAAEAFDRAGMEGPAANASSNHADVLLEIGDLATAQAIYDRSVAVYRRAGNLRGVAHDLTGLGYVYTYGGDYGKAEAAFREALEQADELKNPALTVAPITNLAGILIYTNRIGEGRRIAERALEVSRLQRDRASEATLLTLLADVDFQRGKLTDSEQAYLDLIELAESPGGVSENLIWALMGITEVQKTLGDLAGALEHGDRAVDLAGDLGNPQNLGYVLFARAQVHGELADRERAERDLSAAEQAALKTGQELPDLDAKIDLARAALDASDEKWETALEHVERARAFFSQAQSLGSLAESLALKSEIALGQGDATEADRLALRVITEEGAPAVVRTHARLTHARALRALQRFDEAAEVGLHALDEAEAMGAVLPAAMAASILVSLPPGSQPSDVEVVRARGSRALESYLGKVPENRRQAQLERRDVRDAAELLAAEL
jgi:tetratricopeptide (TPR) repeat protein